MEMIVLILFINCFCLAAWIAGEVFNYRPGRIAGALACFVVFSTVAAIVSGIRASLSIGIPVSEEIHAYLEASAAQLKAGNTEFVFNEFAGFKERAHVTYETGYFIKAVGSETERMSAGPP